MFGWTLACEIRDKVELHSWQDKHILKQKLPNIVDIVDIINETYQGTLEDHCCRNCFAHGTVTIDWQSICPLGTQRLIQLVEP